MFLSQFKHVLHMLKTPVITQVVFWFKVNLVQIHINELKLDNHMFSCLNMRNFPSAHSVLLPRLYVHSHKCFNTN